MPISPKSLAAINKARQDQVAAQAPRKTRTPEQIAEDRDRFERVRAAKTPLEEVTPELVAELRDRLLANQSRLSSRSRTLSQQRAR